MGVNRIGASDTGTAQLTYALSTADKRITVDIGGALYTFWNYALNNLYQYTNIDVVCTFRGAFSFAPIIGAQTFILSNGFKLPASTMTYAAMPLIAGSATDYYSAVFSFSTKNSAIFKTNAAPNYNSVTGNAAFNGQSNYQYYIADNSVSQAVNSLNLNNGSTLELSIIQANGSEVPANLNGEILLMGRN